ncbi:MAG: LON peptidase substrate-binding domain-containing protein [Myxococcota bacterium]
MVGNRRDVPIFPLSNVSLFPGVRAPFHIFEPRYQQMTEAALAGDRRLTMAVVLPDSVADMVGDPPVFDIACAGEIRDSRRLPDGRYQFVLSGTHRVRIVDEPARPPGRLYRIASVEDLDDPFDADSSRRVAAMRMRIVELVRELTGGDVGGDIRFDTESYGGIDDATFVNVLCHALPFPAREKQGLLEADGTPARCERLIEVLEFSVAAAEARKVPNSGRFH